MKFEVLISVTMKTGLFWNVKQCRLLNATSVRINILNLEAVIEYHSSHSILSNDTNYNIHLT